MSNWNLDVTAELAEKVEERLREFARDAELDLSLLVDDSGSMIAGVASRPDIDVATVGALVAGAYGAVRGLSRELGDGESGDCVCHGSANNIYLRSVVGRFVLLGVSESTLPLGVIREKAAHITGALDEMLKEYAPQPNPIELAEDDEDFSFPDAPQSGEIPQPAPAASDKPETSDFSTEVPPGEVPSGVESASPDQEDPPSDEKPPNYVFEIG